MKKSTTMLIISCALIVGFTIFVASNGNPFKSNDLISDSNNQGSNNLLSGNVVAMNPDRAMAGAPCHFMGGGYMGDCQPREIEFEAWKYDWSEPTITVKTGELVRIIGTSRDVAHGIAIPAAKFNLLLEPGKTSVGEFIAPAPGTYDYGCSVMCGPGHHDHRGKLIVTA